MAIEVVTIRIQLSWVRDRPDGSVCCRCGDVCYLTMWRLVLWAPKLLTRTETPHCLCGSCYDAIEDRLYDD